MTLGCPVLGYIVGDAVLTNLPPAFSTIAAAHFLTPVGVSWKSAPMIQGTSLACAILSASATSLTFLVLGPSPVNKYAEIANTPHGTIRCTHVVTSLPSDPFGDTSSSPLSLPLPMCEGAKIAVPADLPPPIPTVAGATATLQCASLIVACMSAIFDLSA